MTSGRRSPPLVHPGDREQPLRQAHHEHRPRQPEMTADTAQLPPGTAYDGLLHQHRPSSTRPQRVPVGPVGAIRPAQHAYLVWHRGRPVSSQLRALDLRRPPSWERPWEPHGAIAREGGCERPRHGRYPQVGGRERVILQQLGVTADHRTLRVQLDQRQHRPGEPAHMPSRSAISAGPNRTR